MCFTLCVATTSSFFTHIIQMAKLTVTSTSSFRVGWNILLTCAMVQVTTAFLCDRDVTSIQRAYCSSAFSFKGTIISIEGGEIDSTSFDDTLGMATDGPSRGTVDYNVLIDEIYKGLDQKYLGRSMTLHSDYDAARGYRSKLQSGVAYLFEVDSFQHLDICDRVDQFSDISEEVRHGLSNGYALSCSSSPNHNEQKSGSSEGEPDQSKGPRDEIKPRVRGNYHARNPITRSKPQYKWNPKCKCKQRIFPKKDNKKKQRRRSKEINVV